MGNTILLLEPDVRRRRLLRRALEHRGHTVSAEAGSAAEFVIASARLERAPDAVLVSASLDARLPTVVKKTFPLATVLHESVGASQPALSAAGA